MKFTRADLEKRGYTIKGAQAFRKPKSRSLGGGDSGKTPDPKSTRLRGAQAKTEALEGSQRLVFEGSRVWIFIISWRSRLCDPDAIHVKGAVDSLVRGGIIKDDSGTFVAGISVSQIKCKLAEEKTEIIVTTKYGNQ